jgi:hypothetical protein
VDELLGRVRSGEGADVGLGTRRDPWGPAFIKRKVLEMLRNRGVAWAVCLGLSVSLLCGSGCGQPASDDDLTRARSVVQRVLFSTSYEDFLQGFTKERRSRMVETAIWIRWWEEKISKDRSAWAISSASDSGNGVIEVVVQHRRRATSRQRYRLVRDGSTWAIREIESER